MITAQPVACPSCHRTDDLREQALRPTWQPVKGLQADGDCESYGEFDYGDDTIVVGYSCGCGWVGRYRADARTTRAQRTLYDAPARAHGEPTTTERADMTSVDGIKHYTEQDLRDAETRRVNAIADAAVPTSEATDARNEIVRALLHRQDWTMQRVATVLGVSRAHVNHIDKGRR